MHLPPCFLAPLSQSFEKVLPINVVEENVLPPVSPTHDVVILRNALAPSRTISILLSLSSPCETRSSNSPFATVVDCFFLQPSILSWKMFLFRIAPDSSG